MKLLKILFLSTLIFAATPCVYADDDDDEGTQTGTNRLVDSNWVLAIYGF